MSAVRPTPTQQEKVLNDEDFIVSKTDLRGIITYGNRVFIGISGYEESELLGAPHNILRHPDMPRVVFKLLWDTIQAGREINAYVKNLAKDGSFYWVFANITPAFDERGAVSGYYSVRRKPKAAAIETFTGIYRAMLEAERRAGGGQAAMKASQALLEQTLQEKGVSYDEFVLGV
ncbi:chemotaxis protein [Geothrix rubra]|uniref:Chemotaxis protein n=1 Tax=Geothrix rubra TaxID=2927977 RepID=A0ABQ5Q8E6_9BACT|nr:PAS domain-containing protein [Geothrix rubra]GLH70943.1 chemotaxis protein [Geothrix rubra]